ncbi:MAG: HTH domain-containing protein, partial [Oscillospiraceae bacterium]|nr:HTH domain-containing protein [Oscillospiraceae bacterium]
MHSDILKMLRQAEGFLSGEQMSRLLGVSRAAVWKQIKALQQAGYEIESATNKGYRLVSEPDLLTQETVCAALAGHRWADRVRVFAEVDSTNRVAKELGASG